MHFSLLLLFFEAVLVKSGESSTEPPSELAYGIFRLVDESGNDVSAGERGLLLYEGGTVCDDGFNIFSARAICRAMGYRKADSWDSGNFFGEKQSEYSIRLDDVFCYGGWKYGCRYNRGDHNCEHSEDVFLSCSQGESPEDLIYFIFGEEPKKEGKEDEEEKGRREKDEEGEAMFSLVDQNGNEISAPGTVGLLLYNGGTVCDDDFQYAAVQTICKELGFSDAPRADAYADGIAMMSGSFYDIQSEYDIKLDEVQCTGNTWSDCSFERVHDCTHSEDLFISCDSPGVEYTVSPSAVLEGPIEKGTDVTFTCKWQPDHYSSSSYGNFLVGSQTENLVSIYVHPQYAKMVLEGRWNPYARAYANINNDIGLATLTIREVSKADEYLFACVVKDYYSQHAEPQLTQSAPIRLSVLGSDQVESKSTMEPTEEPTELFRFVDDSGNDDTFGGLLLYKGGTVCDDGFDSTAAKAICREMGYGGFFNFPFSDFPWAPRFDIQFNYDIKLDEVDCKSENWADCSFEERSHDCTHSEDVILLCNPEFPCVAGFYRVGQSEMSDGVCVKCPENTYSSEGADSCTKCPPGTTSNAGSTSENQCEREVRIEGAGIEALDRVDYSHFLVEEDEEGKQNEVWEI